VRTSPLRYNRSMSAPTPSIELALDDLDHLFVAPADDPFAEHFSYLSGVDRMIADLRGRRGTQPVPVRIALPADQITPVTTERITRALHRYCDEHVTVNRDGRRAARLDGWSSLRFGAPMALLGITLVGVSSQVAVGVQEIDDVLLELLGWVIAWVGLWFPVDLLIFGPLIHGRENRAWKRLRAAPITVVALAPSTPDAPLP